MKIIVDDEIPYIQGHVEHLGQVQYLPAADITPATVRQADILIIRTRTHCNAALLDSSNVRFIATATIGYDHLDTAYLHQRGILWANCPGCNASSVAQYVRSALYLLAQDGMICLSDCTMGVVGVGHVGSLVAQVGKSLGCRVLLNDPPRAKVEGIEGFVSLNQLAAEADIISWHTPLTTNGPDATYHLGNMPFFKALERTPIILNAGRGEAIDETALLYALHHGLVRAAIIDTWEHEPIINKELLFAAYLATPHIAGYSADGKANATRMALQAVARFLGVAISFDIQPPKGIATPLHNASPAMLALSLYNPQHDSKALKQQPNSFEWLRGHYPIRREQFS